MQSLCIDKAVIAQQGEGGLQELERRFVLSFASFKNEATRGGSRKSGVGDLRFSFQVPLPRHQREAEPKLLPSSNDVELSLELESQSATAPDSTRLSADGSTAFCCQPQSPGSGKESKVAAYPLPPQGFPK